MIKNSAFFLFLVIVAIALNFLTITCTSPQAAAMPPPSPPATLQLNISVHQLSNIIDALIGSADFANWTAIFSSIDPSIFPGTATLFVPDDSALFSSQFPNVDPLVFAYHIVPQRLAFSELCQFNTRSRLPTLLLDKYILITSNSEANFTLDDSRLTRPDLFSTDSVVIHGISSILDYNVYGGIPDPNSEAQNPKTESAEQMMKNTTNTITATSGTPPMPPPREEVIGQEQPSCAMCLCGKIKALLLLAWFCLSRGSRIQDLRSAFM